MDFAAISSFTGEGATVGALAQLDLLYKDSADSVLLLHAGCLSIRSLLTSAKPTCDATRGGASVVGLVRGRRAVRWRCRSPGGAGIW